MLNKKTVKFGKSFKDVDQIKKNFFFENNILLKKQNKLNKFYISQPVEKDARVCNKKLKGNLLESQIKYIECKYCSHINSCYKDTKILLIKFM